jgi:AcrR family transcriptional regulator
MTTTTKALPRRGLRPEKRAAIIAAARSAFAESGFARTSTDVIAAQAGVSTRTLYNHFASKDELLHRVLVEGAGEVAQAFLTAVADVDTSGAGVEESVTTIARALLAHRLEFPEHFALANRVRAEPEHLPEALLAEWRDAGPHSVEQRTAQLLAELSRQGALRTADADESASQLMLLTAGAIAFQAPPGTALAHDTAESIVARGVHTFLYGHVRQEPDRGR